MNTERNLNVDKIRFFAILFVVCHHCIVNDVGLQNYLRFGDEMSFPIMYSFMNAVAIIGVNLFFLASGYCRIELKFEKVFRFVLQVYALFAPIQILGFALGTVEFNRVAVVNLIDPFDYYWFLITYLFIMLFSPFLNMIVDKMTIKDFAIFIMLIIFIFCGYGFFMDYNLNIRNGYSFIMATALYLIGGGIKKHFRIFENIHYDRYIYLIAVSLNVFLVNYMYHLGHRGFSWKLYSYNNPLVFASSCMFFLSVLKSKKQWKWSTHIAKATLAIYIIHSTCWLTKYRGLGLSKLLRGYFWTDWIILILYALFIIILGTAYYNLERFSLFQILEKISTFVSEKFSISVDKLLTIVGLTEKTI